MKRLLAFTLGVWLACSSQALSFELADIACETSGTETDGTLDLAGAASGGYLGFEDAGITNGATIPYQIRNGAQLETGWGVFTNSSPDTLTRNASWSTDGIGVELTLSGLSTVCIGPITDIWDPLDVAHGGTGQTTEAEALGEMTQALTEDTSPDYTADFVATYDANADTGKRVKLQNLRGAAEFFWYTGSTCPPYSLTLNGASVSRTTYARLWSKVSPDAVSQGSKDDADYGTGNGSTTFTLMNLTTDDHFIRAGTYGTEQADGAPNITGALINFAAHNTFNGTGAFTETIGGNTNIVAGSSNPFVSASFDASNSNAKYGAASEIRPTNITMTPCVVF